MLGLGITSFGRRFDYDLNGLKLLHRLLPFPTSTVGGHGSIIQLATVTPIRRQPGASSSLPSCLISDG